MLNKLLTIKKTFKLFKKKSTTQKIKNKKFLTFLIRKIIFKKKNKKGIKNKFFKKKRSNIKKLKLKRKYKYNSLELTFKKVIFCKKFFKPESLFFFKKLVNYIKHFYNSKLNSLKEKALDKKNYKQIELTYKNWLPKKDIKMLNLFFFLLKKNKIKTKNFLLIQKKFFYFLLKYKLHKEKINRYYIKKIFSYSFNKKPFLKKKSIINYKKLIYSTKKKKTIKINKLLYNELLGLLIKKGEKNKAITILNKALLKANNENNKYKLKYISNLILKKIFNRLKISVEIKKIRKRRNFHFVPFPIKKKRKIFIISKWLLIGSKNQKLKKNFDIKLKSEIIQLLNNKKCTSYNLKKQNISKILNNKSNAHFRW